MKKIILVLFSIIYCFESNAQSAEITPFYGFFFSSKIKGSFGKLSVKNSAGWGVIIDLDVPDSKQFELSYSKNNTQVKGDRNIDSITNFDLTIEHLQFGVLRVFADDNDDARPFAGFTLGGTRYNPRNSVFGDTWLLSFGVQGGIKLFVSEVMAFRLQGRFIFPLDYYGSGVFCGVGNGGVGCGLGAYARIPSVHFDLSTGLVYRIRGKN